MKRLFLIIFLISALWLRLPAQVATGSRLISLEECVDSALARNPAVAAAGLAIERARILKGTAFNPSFTDITLKQETTGGGGPENGVLFSQEFDFPSVYVARHRSLDAREKLERNRFAVMAAKVEGEVEDAYQTMVYCRELLRLNERLEAVYDTFCRVATIKLELGEGGALELMNAERSREKNRLDRLSISRDYDDAASTLRRLTGISGDIAPATDALSPIEYDFSPNFDFANTAAGRMALGEIAVAQREETLAKNEFLPGIHFGATVQALIKGFNPYHIDRSPFEKGNFMGFEVGISVPLFFGANNARVKAARMESNISRLNYESADAGSTAEVDNLIARIEGLRERVNAYKSSGIHRADEIFRIAEVSYRLGEIDYLEYIANVETVFSVYREYADLIYEYNRNVINLKTLISDR